MISSTLLRNDIIKQDAKVGSKVKKGFSLNKLIHNLIREYGTYSGHGYYDVDVDNFCLSDKKLLISHLDSAEEYAWACEQPTRVEALFSEHKTYIEELINDECWEVYQEDQEEMRSYK